MGSLVVNIGVVIMKLYLGTKVMTFDEESNLVEHEIILSVTDKEFYGYDEIVELSDDDKFIKDTMKIVYKKDQRGNDTKEIDYRQFMIREQETWNSFPLYEFKDGKIIPFDYNKYSYFANTDRRVVLSAKINELYNSSSELKILRKTFRYIMDSLKIKYPDDFKKYNDKVEEVINKNPKN